MNERPDTPEIAEDAVTAQAERWFARMRSDRVEPVDQFRFRNWLAEDPAHEQEYHDLQELWDNLTPYGETDEVRAMVNVNKKGSDPFLLTFRWRAAAAAAVVVLLLGGLFAANPTIYTATYETGIGGRNSHHLLDGTRITLNTDTALHVQYDLRSRRIRLENGQAHFEVSRSRYWPFEVDAGTSVVRALGTTFDVYRRNDEIQVTLLKGRVEVTEQRPAPGARRPARNAKDPAPSPQSPVPSPRDTPHASRLTPHVVLEPGQQVTVSPRGLSEIRRASTPETTAWLYGRLVFDGERLADAVAEVNRYSTVRLTIDNPELADVRISGVFRAGGAETFVDALEASFPLRARLRNDGSLVLIHDANQPLPERLIPPT